MTPGPSGVAAALDDIVGDQGRRRSLAFAAVVERSPDITAILGEDGRIRYASPAATDVLGRPAAWLVGQPLEGLVHPEDRPRFADLTRATEGGTADGTAELRLSHVHGRWVPTEATASDLRDEPSVQGIVLTLRDVSERKAVEEELRHLALHDPLTKLANRALFRDHVEHALARSRRTTARPHAVLFLDLDGFKTINDSLGHAAGDEVLVTVAERVRAKVRPGDTAARLGGDEFAVLLENTSERDAVLMAQRILDVLGSPFVVHGKEVVLTGSLGIAFSGPDQDVDELLRNADVTMYTAKAEGKGRYQLFKPAMHLAALKRLDLEADLRRAVEVEGELVLHYQPIVSLQTGDVAGMEVLVRWRHPERGLLAPADFISVAEDSGLIRPMGRLILRQACEQAQAWDERFPGAAPLRLCVNVSVRQVEHAQFYDEVEQALEDSGLRPESLTIEITESLFMSDFQATVEKLWRLKGLGIKLAIDDFGTGYSSLSYLRSLPIDILKIDKCFVDGVTRGPEQSAVARAVVKLARTFGLETVAEGIELPEQLAELLVMGADMGQGYYFARPLDAPGTAVFLAGRVGLPAAAAARRAM